MKATKQLRWASVVHRIAGRDDGSYPDTSSSYLVRHMRKRGWHVTIVAAYIGELSEG